MEITLENSVSLDKDMWFQEERSENNETGDKVFCPRFMKAATTTVNLPKNGNNLVAGA